MKEDDIKPFMDHIKRTCLSSGVTLRMIHDDHVIMTYGDTQTKVSGYFDDQTKVLCFATKLPLEIWFSVAVHEFHHMEQWIQQFPTMMTIHQHARIWKWLNHEIEMSPADISCDILANRTLELDAERRTLQAIKQNNLPLDPIIYAKQANAYLFSYQYAEKHRDWLSGDRAPYKNAEIVEAMPCHFNLDYNTDNKPYLNLYEKIYLKTVKPAPVEKKSRFLQGLLTPGESTP